MPLRGVHEGEGGGDKISLEKSLKAFHNYSSKTFIILFFERVLSTF
jgi:hypothetical protein